MVRIQAIESGSIADALDLQIGTRIVRITGDCPLHDGAEVDRVVRFRARNRLHYASNCHPPTLPDGLDVEVFTRGALEVAARLAVLRSEREHVTPWMRRVLLWRSVESEPDLSRWRLTVDTPADLALVREVMARLGTDCTWMDAVRLLETDPSLAAINAGTERNEGYRLSLEREGT